MTIDSINWEKCIGCGTCVATCPADVIRLDKKTRKAKITYPEDCQSCHLCRLFCTVSDDVITVVPETCLEPMISWG